MIGVMDVHVSIEAHISLQPMILLATHVLLVGDILKEKKTQGLSKAWGLRHPHILMDAIVFSNPFVSSVPQILSNSHFSMDVELSHNMDVSMEDPSSIDLESLVDQNW